MKKHKTTLDEVETPTKSIDPSDLENSVLPAEAADLENVNEPSEEALVVAKLLLGTAKSFSEEESAILDSLQRFGISACAGDEGWVRGYRWREYIRKM